jgi:hypothetical protein
MRLTRSRSINIGFFVLFLIYGAVFIHKTSSVFANQRHFVLFDDAMISMQYARNLAEGHGLVWNPGEHPVEGFTNPLWVFTMALIHGLGVQERQVALVVQILSLGLLAVNLFLVTKISTMLSNGSRVAVWSALLLTALYLPLNTWALEGTEFAAVVVAVSACVYLALRSLKSGRPSRLLYILLGLGTWLRIDMVVSLLSFGVYLAVVDRPNLRKHLLYTSAAFVLFVGSQTLLRFLYYGELLPNTYYLKLTGYPLAARVAHGAGVFWRFAYHFNPILLALPLLWALRRRTKATSLLLTVFAAQCAYSVYIGGDAWERWKGANRFVSGGMPLLFVLLGLMLADAHRWALRKGQAWRKGRTVVHAAVVLAVALATVQVNLFNGRWSLAGTLLIERPLDTLANGFALVHGLLARSITTEDATIATVWAGSIPYFSHRHAIDLLGKNDARIAHGPISPAARSAPFYPGHMKWDYAYSIGQMKPDIIHQLWTLPDPSSSTSLHRIPEDARPYVEGQYMLLDLDGYRMLVRKDSRKIDWARINPYVVGPVENQVGAADPDGTRGR